jgi:hypothetical protein
LERSRVVARGPDQTTKSRAKEQMKNNHAGGPEEAGLTGPYGEIPRKLKEYYDTIQEEAIPDRFLDLLERLDQAERAAMSTAAAVGESN